MYQFEPGIVGSTSPWKPISAEFFSGSAALGAGICLLAASTGIGIERSPELMPSAVKLAAALPFLGVGALLVAPRKSPAGKAHRLLFGDGGPSRTIGKRAREILASYRGMGL